MSFIIVKEETIFLQNLDIGSDHLKISIQCGSEELDEKNHKNFDALKKIMVDLNSHDIAEKIPNDIPMTLKGLAFWIFTQSGENCLAVCVRDIPNENEVTYIND